MRLAVLVGIVAAGLGLTGAQAAPRQVVETVESQVFQVPGTPSELARKAHACLARLVQPALTTIPTFVSEDIESGVIVANSAFIHAGELTGLATLRSKITFEARDGRFKITHTDIGELYDNLPRFGWMPIHRNKKGFSGGEADLQILSGKVAACVQETSKDW